VIVTPVELVLSRLPDAKRNGRGWVALCPVHEDRRPSLSICEGGDGRALLCCHAGCSNEAIVKTLGLTLRDLMPECDPLSPLPKPAPRRSANGSGDGSARSVFTTAAEAVAELERRHGPRSALWTYQNVAGEPVGVVVRWDTPRGKDIRPVAKSGAGWISGGMPTPRPVYHLPELLPSPTARVYVAEGEKAADAARSLGLLATTSAGGSNAARQTDWSALAGRDVVILPDNDDAGRRYADDVTRLLGRLMPRPTIKVVNLPHLPPHGDAVEYIAARRAARQTDDAIRAEVEGLADTTEPVELNRPGSAILTRQPFPVEALPEPIRSFVAKGARAIGCDPSYVALPLLAALAAAIGNTRRIQLKRGWTEPAIVWAAIVGESGTLKTPAFKLVMQPIRDMQAHKLKEYQAACEQYERDVLQYEAELTAWKRWAANGDGSAGDPPKKPQPPQAERYVVSDTTVEALAPILLANPRGVLLARDELAGWIGSFDRYVGGKGGADAAHWLSMHNGESITVDRKTGTLRMIYVPSAAVSIAGGVQPGILDRVMGYEHRESGLLARLLLAMPPRHVKHWTEATIPESIEASITAIFRALYELKRDHDDNGNPHPRILRLAPDGKRAWIAFYNAHAKEHAELTGDLSAAWSKLEGYAARLALVVHCVRLTASDPTVADPDAVDETSIAAGVSLSRWFGNEARRVYGVLAESDDDRNRRRLVELIQRKGGMVTARDLMRGSRLFATAADAEGALEELVKASVGRWVHDDHGGGRGRPVRRFVLALADSADTDINSANSKKNHNCVSVSAVSGAGSGCGDGELWPDGDGCLEGKPLPPDVLARSDPGEPADGDAENGEWTA